MLACRGRCCNPSGTAEACRTPNSAPSVCKWCTCGRGWWYVSPLLCCLPYIPLFVLLSPFSMWVYYSVIWILCPVFSLRLTQDWPDYSPQYSCLFVTDTVAAQHSGRLKKLLKSRQAKSIPVDRSHDSELWTGWGVAEKYKLKWMSYSLWWPPLVTTMVMVLMFLAWVAARPLFLNCIRSHFNGSLQSRGTHLHL